MFKINPNIFAHTSALKNGNFVIPDYILNFNKKTYGEECPICLEIFGELDEDSLLCSLKCGHSYHKKCVKDWLSKDNSCPNCRIQIK